MCVCVFVSTEWVAGIRTLFTPDTLGVTAYISNRELEFTYTTQPEQFKEQFQENIERTVPLNLLVDDLKKYLHLMSNQIGDIELLYRALRLFQTQRDIWKRKSQLDVKKDYTFGPITMRALHYHDMPEYAIKVRHIRWPYQKIYTFYLIHFIFFVFI